MTTPKGHQFDLSVKILLVACSTHHSLQFDMPHDQVHKSPQVASLEHDPGNRMKIQFDMFYINTHKVWYQNLQN